MFSAALQDGSVGLVNAEYVYTRAEGDSVTLQLFFSLNRRWKFLCKENCEVGNLIETPDNRAQTGRYSIAYHRYDYRPGGTLSVTITQLNKADTGRYRCGVGRRSRASYEEFEVIVVHGEFLPLNLCCCTSDTAAAILVL